MASLIPRFTPTEPAPALARACDRFGYGQAAAELIERELGLTQLLNLVDEAAAVLGGKRSATLARRWELSRDLRRALDRMVGSAG